MAACHLLAFTGQRNSTDRVYHRVGRTKRCSETRWWQRLTYSADNGNDEAPRRNNARADEICPAKAARANGTESKMMLNTVAFRKFDLLYPMAFWVLSQSACFGAATGHRRPAIILNSDGKLASTFPETNMRTASLAMSDRC